MNVLIAEDDIISQQILAHHVGMAGFTYRVAENGRQALELFNEERADLVLTDVNMPEMDGFSVLRAIREQDDQAIVVIITGDSSIEMVENALNHGANNYLHKPIDKGVLTKLLHKYAHLVAERVADGRIERMITDHCFRISIDNQTDVTTRVAQVLVSECKVDFSDKERLDMTLGLDELLTNAIEHGNLRISQEEKEEAILKSDGLHQLHLRRAADPLHKNRRVSIEYHYVKGKYCEWVITDEGPGFDWKNIRNPLDDDGLFRPSGRGIFLSKIVFDELEYRGRGNVVCVRKNLTATQAGPEA